MSSITVTVSGVDKWVAELEASRKELPDQARQVVAKGSVNIKKAWRRRWTGFAHLPRIPYSITYDMTESAGRIRSEIGPVDGPELQGFVAPFIEFGGPHNAPHPGGLPSLAEEEPRFYAACENLGIR